MSSIAQRSREQIGALTEIDRTVAEALAARSLAELTRAYLDLQKRGEAVEALMEQGQAACGCDVAFSNLLIVVGFAVNKLDGAGRYQDWMREESLDLLENYHGLAAGCAADAGLPPFVSRVTARHIETL